MIQQHPRLVGQLKVPGDKSITHRALLFAALCTGQSSISEISPAQDCQSSLSCLQQLGLTIEYGQTNEVKITGYGLASLKKPYSVLNVGNSGTTIRLLTGLLAGQDFESMLDGDASIRSRPMGRVIEPITLMGATFSFLAEKNYAPFKIQGASLNAINYSCPIASAQIQTALVLAGLQASGVTTVELSSAVRDHTIRLLRHIDQKIVVTEEGLKLSIQKLDHEVPPFNLVVPGDLSSAAFFMVAAALLPGSNLRIPAVGINPGRTLIVEVLKNMGAAIKIENLCHRANEPVADICVEYSSSLKGTTVAGAAVPLGIDEIPVIALLGCFGNGNMSVRNVGELRYKESDRLRSITQNLRDAGADITETDDGFDISGKQNLNGGSLWKSYGDHRLAMTGLIARLLSKKPITIDDTECIRVSYPQFQDDLNSLIS